ncbi:MAG: motility protein A [bacterium]
MDIADSIEQIKTSIPFLASKDIATIIGLTLGTIFVAIGIMFGGNPIIFIDIASVFIVIGGTIGVTVIRFPLKTIFEMLTITKNAFLENQKDNLETVSFIVKAAKRAKKNGLLSLEETLEDEKDDFVKKALQGAIDGLEKKQISLILNLDIAYLASRHKTGQDMFIAIADAAPAFGMIGTLIGLVQMLSNLSNPSSIGPAMAVALLTTLYGALMANLIALPIADKLKFRSEQEVTNKRIIVSGIEGIIDGEHPTIIEGRLLSFIEPQFRIVAGFN